MCRSPHCDHAIACVRCLGKGSYLVDGTRRDCARCLGTGVLRRR